MPFRFPSLVAGLPGHLAIARRFWPRVFAGRFRLPSWALTGFLGVAFSCWGSPGEEVLVEVNTNPPPHVSILDPKFGVGSWIWAAQTYEQQTCHFWRAFEIPGSDPVRSARLTITADNTYRLFLDGREVGKGGEWQSVREYDLTPLMDPGPHVLGVEGFNDYDAAGVILGLKVELLDGEMFELASDENWRVVPLSERHWETRKVARPEWPAATIVAPYGGGIWKQKVFRLLRVPAPQRIKLEFWQTGWFQVVLLSICGSTVLISLLLMARLGLQARAQRFLHRERARIARDIHDDLGARATELVLLGEVAQSKLSAPSETRADFEKVCELTRGLLGAVDEIVWTVNSRRDTLQDFETYVCNYAQTFLQSTAIRCRLAAATEIPETAFDLAIRRNLFLAIKEALNNAARHSRATELLLKLSPAGKKIYVMVEDNGRGFDLNNRNQERNGVTNMIQRIAEVGGSCLITSKPGAGCRVEFLAPLEHSQENRWGRWHWRWRRKSRPAAELRAARPVSAPPAAGSARI